MVEPGSGLSTGQRQWLDPGRYRIIQFDQRGCGGSTPHASDPATDMSRNTTDHLISDMERLRHHLGVDHWLLFGGSWGSTLILAYAERYPERVSEIVICSVTMTRRSETTALSRCCAVLSRGMGAVSRWRFRGRPRRRHRGGVREAHGGFEPEVRTRAAIDWGTWEAVLSLEPSGKPNPYSVRPPADLLAFVRITTRYFSNGAWLEEGALLAGARRLAGIPGVLVHGRLDLSCPLKHGLGACKCLADARLVVVADSVTRAATR